jgi:hypothetical protein
VRAVDEFALSLRAMAMVEPGGILTAGYGSDERIKN